MVIRLLPNQVPKLWNQIKYAVVNTDRVSEKDMPRYLNDLLHALLSDKAQCFIRFDEDRMLKALCITKIGLDELSGERSLVLQCLFSYQRVPEQEWKDNLEFIELFARKSKCKSILAYSENQRIFDLPSSTNFEERFRCFIKRLED